MCNLKAKNESRSVRHVHFVLTKLSLPSFELFDAYSISHCCGVNFAFVESIVCTCVTNVQFEGRKWKSFGTPSYVLFQQSSF